MKIRLILLKKGNIMDIVKADWDQNTNIAKYKKTNFYVDSQHFFYRKRRIYAFVDVNRSRSLSNCEVRGESIAPKLRKTIDMKLKNHLDYLTERGFWVALRTTFKKDWTLIIISVLCGMGLWEIIRSALSYGGIVLP